ncbi:pheromone-regulated protein prm10 [Stygiomarasmius scandens]|uniref:Pheromone-regulated protein prm10 n=1 Tax=Marasmiellus scandens TaxID=2682957 RepID=A0ABR1K419_9AGAR
MDGEYSPRSRPSLPQYPQGAYPEQQPHYPTQGPPQWRNSEPNSLPQSYGSPIPPSQPQWRNPFVNSPVPRPYEPPHYEERLQGSPRNSEHFNKFSFSSYQHPHDIPPPPNAYSSPNPNNNEQRPLRSALRRSVSFANGPGNIREYEPEPEELPNQETERVQKRRGIPSQILDLHALNRDIESENEKNKMRRRQSSQSSATEAYSFTTARPSFRRADSCFSTSSDVLDPDDPHVTGARAECLDDPEDLEKNTLRQMDYRSRRKHLMRVKIEFNVSSMMNRQEFLIKLARALMTFGAPSHRIESQLKAAARILEVQAEFIHLPGVIISSFGDQELGCSETHFIKCSGRLSLGALHKVHLIYRSVVHDEISARKATGLLDDLLSAPPLYSLWFRCFLAFCLSALICPLAFGGSFLDMWFAGVGAFILSILNLFATKSALYANVFEISAAIVVSFSARGLSSIRSQIFCYTAISSAGIIGILPGYLILSSSLELASKNIVCGSVKMVYALIYTLFLVRFRTADRLGLYLLLDKTARRRLDNLSSALSTTISMTGSWVADNGTVNDTLPIVGTWTFTHPTSPLAQDIIDGCYRPASFPWYLQQFPAWTAFIIVPLFSLLSSLANLQPFRSKQLPVMVIISCASYASNKVANHYIFNRSDVVSAIGAFTVGVLGNVYSRKMGGTAFTSMVTGVLFLVPSGLSQAGGITANGNGIDIGGAMIAVTIGITVGLFMSQALVYMFGTRKNAAVFSF